MSASVCWCHLPHRLGALVQRCAPRLCARTIWVGVGVGLIGMGTLLDAAPPVAQPPQPPSLSSTTPRTRAAETGTPLATALGVPPAALQRLLTIVEQAPVPADDRDCTLRHLAERYRALADMLTSRPTNEPAVVTRTQLAHTALAQGDFARVETLLLEIFLHDLERALQREADTPGRLATAASYAALGTFKMLQRAYADAVTYYRQATAVVPAARSDLVAASLRAWGAAALQAGDRTSAEPLLQRALLLQEQVLAWIFHKQ